MQTIAIALTSIRSNLANLSVAILIMASPNTASSKVSAEQPDIHERRHEGTHECMETIRQRLDEPFPTPNLLELEPDETALDAAQRLQYLYATSLRMQVLVASPGRFADLVATQCCTERIQCCTARITSTR